jgi:3-oxoacyl-[acyl-carrier-protein] synthase-1
MIVDYVNDHAPSIPVGDPVEACVISQVFGGGPLVSSTKSMTGHEPGAAESNELIYCLLMMEHDFISLSTNNVEEIDPKCVGINLVENRALERRFKTVGSNSFGFEGVNTCRFMSKCICHKTSSQRLSARQI